MAISAMLMVNCGLPRMNGLVPSSGSTRKNESPVLGMRPTAAASSETTGTPGATRASPARMMSSDSRSATVTGLLVRLGLDRHAGREMGHLHARGGQRHAQESFGKLLHVGCLHDARLS